MTKTLEVAISNLTSNETNCVSSTKRSDDNVTHPLPSQPHPLKKKRNLPGHPDPDAEVIALSPRTLLATNRFVCDICNKGFKRDQNLQLHRRGHKLSWKLKQRSPKETVRKKVYVCPETTCVHHEPSRALGDLTGIKKHFCRKHTGEKKWKCEKCSKKYAVQSDWKAHAKVCGTREYRCDYCGTLFSRRDSFITHRAFCEENTRNNHPVIIPHNNIINAELVDSNHELFRVPIIKNEDHHHQNFRSEISPWQQQPPPAIGPGGPGPPAPAAAVDFHPHPPHISATELLQRVAHMGSKHAAGPSRDDAIINVSSSDAVVSYVGSPAGEISISNPPPPPPAASSSLFLHGFDAPENFDETLKFLEQFSNTSGQTQTRDFLGMRGFSESDDDHILMSMAGLSEYMNSSNNTGSDHGKAPIN